MASSQIWSFDSLEIPRLERMSTPGHPELGSSVLTAKTLMLEEIAKEAEASRLYEEVSPILQSISRKQAALKEIAEDLDRVQVRLDPIGWSAGLEYLQKLAEALEACFDQTHEPDRLSPEEVFELHEKIVDQAQSRKFFDAIASFRESCLKPLDALPGSVVKSLFRPLFSLARPHEAKPSDRRALEIVFFAKALSKMMIPGLWLEAILARVPQRPGIGRIPFGLLYANPQGPGQVQLIRSLNSFVSEATKVDNIDLQEDQLIVEVYMKARADGGMSGIKNLQEAIVAINDEGFDSWHKGASGARVGKTLRAIRALSQLPTSIDTTVSPNEGLNLKLKVEISRHSLPTGERWPSLTP
ncbi:MAG: hypothetical protein K0U98_21405 [Deltaproteobacteria bacterium]|nr:hypothetical protein [Deltaproteobacteria bacterium]